MYDTPHARSFALILATFLMIEGVWGLFSPVVFAVFTTNVVHAIIHITLGLVGISAALRGHAPGYLVLTGAILLVVGAVWFVPGGRELTVAWFNVNRAVAILNIALGAVALFMGLGSRDRTPGGRHT